MISKLNENISHISLTGQTKNRKSIIDSFNNDPSIQVGIFSLKAGGVGINLTSADYVFLYDPWWNPAVEQQAIDQCIALVKKILLWYLNAWLHQQ